MPKEGIGPVHGIDVTMVWVIAFEEGGVGNDFFNGAGRP